MSAEQAKTRPSILDAMLLFPEGTRPVNEAQFLPFNNPELDRRNKQLSQTISFLPLAQSLLADVRSGRFGETFFLPGASPDNPQNGNSQKRKPAPLASVVAQNELTRLGLDPHLELAYGDTAAYSKERWTFNPHAKLTRQDIKDRRIVTGYRWTRGLLLNPLAGHVAEQLAAKIITIRGAKDEQTAINYRLVEYITRLYSGRGIPDEDILQEAYAGLQKAITSFDWRKGYPFFIYAQPTIKGEIRRAFRDTALSIKKRRSTFDNYGAILEAEDELLLEGEVITADAVAKKSAKIGTNVPTKIVADSQNHAVIAQIPLSLDAQPDGEKPIADSLSTREDFTELVVEKISYLDKLRPDKIREFFPDVPGNTEQTRLNRRYCGMIVAYFFLDINQDDIARIYGITQPTVNRQLHKALKLMQDRVDPDGMRSRGTPIIKFEMKKKEKKDKE